MEHQEIRSLAQMMKQTGLTVLELHEDGFSLRMERAGAAQGTPADHSCPAQEQQEQAGRPDEAGQDTYTVTAPMIGVYYASPSPELKPYVSIGDTVRPGDVLCIIEAMKMMNEITAERGGVVTEICAGNRQVVDFGHPLFHIRPVQPASEFPVEERTQITGERAEQTVE